MTKHKEIMERYEELVSTLLEETSFSEYIRSAHHAKIKEFIKKELYQQLEELEGWVEKVEIKGYHNEENIKQAKFLQEVYDEMIKPVIVSNIREQKEMLKVDNS